MKLFAGCRSRSEARQRFRAFYAQHVRDQVRKLETDMHLSDADPDDIGAHVERLAEHGAASEEQALAALDAAFDELGLPA